MCNQSCKQKICNGNQLSWLHFSFKDATVTIKLAFFIITNELGMMVPKILEKLLHSQILRVEVILESFGIFTSNSNAGFILHNINCLHRATKSLWFWKECYSIFCFFARSFGSMILAWTKNLLPKQNSPAWIVSPGRAIRLNIKCWPGVISYSSSNLLWSTSIWSHLIFLEIFSMKTRIIIQSSLMVEVSPIIDLASSFSSFLVISRSTWASWGMLSHVESSW